MVIFLRDKGIKFVSFFILFFFFTGLSRAQESQYSFNLMAPYNSGGDLYPGDPPSHNDPLKMQEFYVYIDGKITKLGNIEMIRMSGRPGIVPEKLPDNQCPPGDTPPCFTDKTSATDYPYPWPDDPVRHAAAISEILMDVGLWERWWDNNGIEYVHDEADLQALIRLADKAVKRYDGDCDIDDNGNCTDKVETTQESSSLIFPKVRYWQIVNEPGHENWKQNETKNINGREVMTLSYTIHTIANNIKASCPDCKIVLPGAAFNSADGWYQEFLAGPQGGRTNCTLYPALQCGYYKRLITDLDFLKGTGTNNFDVFDFHLHHQQNITNSAYTTFKGVTNTVLNLLSGTGHANIPIWVTETSSWTETSDAESWMPNNPYPVHTETDQAVELAKRYLYPFSLGVKKVFWAPGLIDGMGPTSNNGYWNHIGLIFNNGTEKKSFCALKMLTNKLATFSSASRIDMGNVDVYLLRFSNFQNPNKKPVYAIWQENTTSTFNLSSYLPGQITVTNINNVVTSDTPSSFNVAINPKIIEEKSESIPVSCADLTPTLSPSPTPSPPAINLTKGWNQLEEKYLTFFNNSNCTLLTYKNFFWKSNIKSYSFSTPSLPPLQHFSLWCP